ncbi:glucose 1-dehydrogenase [Vibrio fluvialis]|nr:glucose 1-dehydrogenase [Vibrio fluvialis]
MTKFNGKVAVVTGASKGLGAAIAKTLAQQGASVVVNYASSKEGADEVVNAIVASGGNAIAVQGDVSKPDDAERLIDTAVKEFGQLDVLINNAGIYDVYAPVSEITEDQYRRYFDINVLGVLMTVKAATKYMKEGSNIINISSVATDVNIPTTSIYTGTKGAVNAISGVLANELAPQKIRVNVVSPGYVRTEGNYSAGIVGSKAETDFVALTPLGRPGEPDDIAQVVAFIASDDARWVTGEIINASGGVR